MERLIRVGHLRRYVQETVRGAEAVPTVERIAANAEILPEPRPIINYILGGPVDDQYQSKRQKRRLFPVATSWARVKTIYIPDNIRAIHSIDGHISFPTVYPFRVITPHHDALVLTLCINDFDVHRVTMGDIALPIKEGPVVQQVFFSVVEDLGPYNAIVIGA